MNGEKTGRSPGGGKIAVFTTTHQTLKAEKLLKERQIPVRPVPRPSRILSECGLALEFNTEDEERLMDICREQCLDLIGTFPHPL